jgi:hypothetical protein
MEGSSKGIAVSSSSDNQTMPATVGVAGVSPSHA